LGCQLPDAILHGKRSCRPHSRAVQRLAVTEFSSEASRLAWAGVCVTGSRTRSRNVCDQRSVSRPFALGRPPRVAVRWPKATGLTSYLSSCFSLAGQRSRPTGSPAFRKVFTGSALDPCPPRSRSSLCLAFRRLSLGGPTHIETARAFPTVLARSSSCAPSG
jgi:hypothetical protein